MNSPSTHVLVGRQPIFGPQLDLYAYELLYRDSQDNQANVMDGDTATFRMILNTFLEIGLDQVVGPHPAFINVTKGFLLGNFYQDLPKDRVVLEVLEDIEPEQVVVKAISRAVSQGYTIALDDFRYRDSLREFLEMATIVKLDVLAHDHEALKHQVEVLQPYKVKLIAEKVETPQDFEFSKSLGFDYFQGYFFCKPSIVQGQHIPVNQMAILSLMAKLTNPDIEFSKIEEIVRQDLSLSAKVLRFVNSAYFGLPKKVDSIRRATTMVGIVRLKSWALVIALAGLEEKPFELLKIGLLRARMCEQLAKVIEPSTQDHFFTVGLFSMLDALFDKPLVELIPSLGLSPEASIALIHHEGIMGKTLKMVLAYESGDWENIADLGFSQSAIQDVYLEAIAWSRNILPLLNS